MLEQGRCFQGMYNVTLSLNTIIYIVDKEKLTTFGISFKSGQNICRASDLENMQFFQDAMPDNNDIYIPTSHDATITMM